MIKRPSALLAAITAATMLLLTGCAVQMETPPATTVPAVATTAPLATATVRETATPTDAPQTKPPVQTESPQPTATPMQTANAAAPQPGDQQAVKTLRAVMAALPVNDLSTIQPVLQKTKELCGESKATNDALVLVAYDFLRQAIAAQGEQAEPVHAADAALLQASGLREIAVGNGATYIVEEKPGFVLDQFGEKVSAGMREYLTMMNREHAEKPVASAGFLAVTWDELADRIVQLEAYAAKYPDTAATQRVHALRDGYLSVYTTGNGLLQDYLFRDGTLSLDVKASYERFLQKYPKSTAHAVIQGYYAALQKQGFEMNGEASDWLAGHGVDTSWLSLGNEDED